MSDDVTPAACRCGGAVHAVDSARCVNGHVLVGNQAAFKHGVRQYEARGPEVLPDDLRTSVDDFRAGLIADKGGLDNLNTLKAGYISNLTDIDVMRRLLMQDLRTRGIFTPKGRVRSTFSKLLDVLDRWDRFAQRVGMEREARPVNPIDAIHAAVEEANRS